LLVFKLYLAEI